MHVMDIEALLMYPRLLSSLESSPLSLPSAVITALYNMLLEQLRYLEKHDCGLVGHRKRFWTVTPELYGL